MSMRAPVSTADPAGAVDPALPWWRRSVAPVVVTVVYCALSVAAFWPVAPWSNTQIQAAKISDSVSAAYFLNWPSFALMHGHNLLYSNYLDYPNGVNVAVNASLFGLGVLVTPLRYFLGPFAVFNLLMRIAFAASALAMYWVLRRYCKHRLPAFIGGLFYGFCPMQIAHNLINPIFTLAPIPPLMFLIIDDALNGRRRTAARNGLILGVLAALQLYANPEILAEFFVVILLSVVISIIVSRRLWQLAVVTRLLKSGVAALIGVVALGAPFIWYYLFGPQHLTAPVVPLQYLTVFRTDLAGLIVPNINELIGPAGLIARGTLYTGGSINETGVYLGIPMIVVLIWFSIRCRRNPTVVFALIMFFVSALLSLGNTLVVNNHDTGIWMPSQLGRKIPILQSAETIRYFLFADLAVAIILAIGLDSLWTIGQPLHASFRASKKRLSTSLAVVVGIAAISLVPLIPRLPYKSATIGQPGLDLPTYFTSSAVDKIKPGAVVITYPYDQSGAIQPELWQLETNFRFRIISGYAYIPDNGGYPFGPPPIDANVTSIMSNPYFLPASPSVPLPPLDRHTFIAVQRAFQDFGVDDVIVMRTGVDLPGALRDLTAILGPPDATEGGVTAWYNIQPYLAKKHF